MEWHFKDDAPIYSQLVTQIRLAVASGTLASGMRLPSVRDMALEAGVNPNTMQRALAELERDGLVFSQRTSGRFVTEDGTMIEEVRQNAARGCVKDFLDAMRGLGYAGEEIIDLIKAGEKEEKQNADT